jgi:hypothetical protein
MKLLYLFLIALFLNSTALAQASWKISLDNKTVLKASLEDEAKNIVRIKASNLKQKRDFIACYTEQDKKKDWERTIIVFDEKDRELRQQKGTTLKVKTSTLRSWFKESKQLKIYTWALPIDPKLKAAIRVRRVHLCTLVLE